MSEEVGSPFTLLDAEARRAEVIRAQAEGREPNFSDEHLRAHSTPGSSVPQSLVQEGTITDEGEASDGISGIPSSGAVDTVQPIDPDLQSPGVNPETGDPLPPQVVVDNPPVEVVDETAPEDNA